MHKNAALRKCDVKSLAKLVRHVLDRTNLALERESVRRFQGMSSNTRTFLHLLWNVVGCCIVDFMTEIFQGSNCHSSDQLFLRLIKERSHKFRPSRKRKRVVVPVAALGALSCKTICSSPLTAALTFYRMLKLP